MEGRVTDTYPTAATIQYQARARLIYNGKVTTLQLRATLSGFPWTWAARGDTDGT